MTRQSLRLSDNDVITFLLNAYFGPVEDPVFTSANAAYLDLCRTIEFKTEPGVGEEIRGLLRQKVIQRIKEDIAVLQKNKGMTQGVYDCWHNRLCRWIVTEYETSHISFHYGQAQKWVNMTMKYLSVINREVTNDYFEFLHVPIDSIVFELAADELNVDAPNCRWSRMEEQDYLDYQTHLRNTILRDKGIAPLLWEFRNWE